MIESDPLPIPTATSMGVLVIEDDPDTLVNLRDILELDDYHVETAPTAAAALDRANWSEFAAILLDRKLPDGTAHELLPQLRSAAPDAAIIVVTGFADLEGAIEALRLGAADYILKPINPDTLRFQLNRIMEQRRATRARARSEAAFRHLVEAAECLIVILRPDHAVHYFSPCAERLTGYSAAEARGRDFGALVLAPGAREAVAAEFERVLQGRGTHGFENAIVCRDGSQRWMVWNSRCLPAYEECGPVVLVVGQDITALKRAQDRALQAERLAAIGHMCAGLAHESRNALQRIQACLEMLAYQVADRPEALDLIARIQRAEDTLTHLFEDVRGYAAPIQLEPRVCDLATVWREAWAHLDGARRGRSATLSERSDGPGTHCRADPFRLEQVFRNIFDNALAACAGPVAIVVATADDRLDHQPALRVSVRDNGPGLRPEQRRRIFESFYTTKTKGTGLGMAIAKRIVEAHGGTIAVGAEDGPGAEVLVTLPRGTP